MTDEEDDGRRRGGEPGEARPQEQSSPEQRSLIGCRVLVVDDEKHMLDLVTAALEPLGIEILRAYSAEGALKLLDRSPDLAVVDVNLGRVSGFDLLEEVRRRGSMPVIMLTARTSEEDAIRGLTLGADDYVRKPFSVRQLVARVERQLRRG